MVFRHDLAGPAGLIVVISAYSPGARLKVPISENADDESICSGLKAGSHVSPRRSSDLDAAHDGHASLKAIRSAPVLSVRCATGGAMPSSSSASAAVAPINIMAVRSARRDAMADARGVGNKK
jgi:hypothetical protein